METSTSEGYCPAARVSTAGLEGLNCKFKYVNAPPPLKIIKSGVGKVILKKTGPLMGRRCSIVVIL